MTDEIEGEGQEAPADVAPSSEAPSDRGEDLESDIRKSIATQRERGPDGKFKATDSSELRRGAAKGIATGAGDIGAPPTEPRQATDAPKIGETKDPTGNRPPAGFSVATKQAWEALPEHVKADIVKREADFEAGFKRFEGLGGFAHEAEKNGTTLQNAVADYVAVENELRKDPVAGVEFLCLRIGWNPVALLRAWAQKYTGPQTGQEQQAPQPQIDPNAIANHAINTVRAEFQRREIDNDISKFESDPANKFFPNVRPLMARLVAADSSLNLQTAYEAACWMNPEIRAILVEEMKGGQDKAAVRTAAKAQNAAKAVTGAPSNSNSGEPPKRRDLSLDEEIRASIRAQQGRA